ncbi:MAG: RMD1 family protein [Alphaproteobacteria bacterium]
MRCVAYCTGENYNLKTLSQFFTEENAKLKLHNKEVLHISNYKDGGDLFFFDYGCVVLWNYKLLKENQVLDLLARFAINPLKNTVSEEFDVTLKRSGSKTIVENDTVILGGNKVLDKLTLSFALSQSVKLSHFEQVLEETGNETKHIPLELATKGKISLSRRQIAKKLGRLFLVRNSINLHTEMLDTPDFFWEYPAHENLYKLITKHLDVPQRVEVLNKRLDMIRDLFSMLEEHLNHQHSSLLEWIIIVLISTEIFLFLVKESNLFSFF